MENRVIYDFVFVGVSELNEEIKAMNTHQDKIIAVTQNGSCYTIFYERNGNERKDDGEA